MLSQRFPVDILGGDKVERISLVELKDRHDIWLVEGRSHSGFLLEALHASLVRGDVSRQDLQRNGAIELCVLGQINFTHSTGAQLLNNQVMTDFLSLFQSVPA